MHSYSLLFILIIIYSSVGLPSEKINARIRREEPEFVQTECILIDSVAKERCSTSTTEHNERHATQTQSCVTDEKFRVKYKVQNGKMVTSTIETYGHNFPRLIQIGESNPCYYNPQNVQIVRWTLTDEDNGTWSSVILGIVFIIMFIIIVAAGCSAISNF